MRGLQQRRRTRQRAIVMSDKYWNRLVSKQMEFATLPTEHPLLAFPDPEVERLLYDAHPDEEGYEAPLVLTRDVTVSHATGSFGVRVYTPDAEGAGRPLLVWCHGGAWAAGDLEGPEGDATSREVTERADAVVVSVDYRLATQGVQYPVPLDDVVAAYRWARENARGLGADPDRITLGGASAGGNLAAGAALWLRDNGDPLPAALALAYPTLHPRMPNPTPELQSKTARMSGSAAFAAEVLSPIVENYIGAQLDQAPVYAMPGLSEDLTGLPPAYIFNDEYDGLRASGERFAEQLAAAGSTVYLETIPDVAHGHFSRPGLPQSRQSHADLARWVLDNSAPTSARSLSAGVTSE